MFNNAKRQMGRAAMKVAKKKFGKSCDYWRDQVEKGEITQVKEEITGQLLNGVNQAESELKNPSLGSDEVNSLLERIDADKVEHQETKMFMKQLEDIDEENEMMEFINSFENYYLDRLDEMVNK